MRMVDADELRHSHCVECTLYPDKCLGKDCDWGSIYHIDHAPTVEAIPVSWIKERMNNIEDTMLEMAWSMLISDWAEGKEK